MFCFYVVLMCLSRRIHMCWLSLASPEDQAITHHSLTLLVRSNTFPSRLSNATTGAADLDDTGLGITSRPGCFGFPMGIFLHLPVRVLFVPSCLFLVLILIVTFMLVDLTLTRRSRSGIIISDCFTIVYPKVLQCAEIWASKSLQKSKPAAYLPVTAVPMLPARCRATSTADFLWDIWVVRSLCSKLGRTGRGVWKYDCSIGHDW